MQVKIKKLHPDALMPKYGSDGAACFDLHCVNGAFVSNREVFSTGLAFEIPEGHVMLVFSRSGHGFTNDTRLANCVGVIDHDYRGEVKVKLRVDSNLACLSVKPGDRIAQAMIVPYPKVEFDWAVMTVPRAKHPTRQRIANELKQGKPLSKYDLELRCHLAMRNVNAYLKIMHEAGEIHIAGYRRDSPHGCPTTMWAYGQGVDAKKPKAKTMAQKSREYRIKNPEVVINEIMRKRAQRYKEKTWQF